MTERVRNLMPKQGTCCGCGERRRLQNFICLDFEAPDGFIGWGCIVCQLQPRGAIALLCDACIESHRQPTHIFGGTYVKEGILVPLEGFERKPFGHVIARHPEMQLQ